MWAYFIHILFTEERERRKLPKPYAERWDLFWYLFSHSPSKSSIQPSTHNFLSYLYTSTVLCDWNFSPSFTFPSLSSQILPSTSHPLKQARFPHQLPKMPSLFNEVSRAIELDDSSSLFINKLARIYFSLLFRFNLFPFFLADSNVRIRSTKNEKAKWKSEKTYLQHHNPIRIQNRVDAMRNRDDGPFAKQRTP